MPNESALPADEKRDLFRVPVATRVQVNAAQGHWLGYSVDCSLGGLGVCVPVLVEIGTEMEVDIELSGSTSVALRGVVRHRRAIAIGPADEPGSAAAGEDEGCVAGLQFLSVPRAVERRLTEFISHHQRRLMPRVSTPVPFEYRLEGDRRTWEGEVQELSPGDAIFVGQGPHRPGARLQVRVEVGHQDYGFDACVVDSSTAEQSDSDYPAHTVRASFDEHEELTEERFRQAVRDLAIERVRSRRRD
jgi:c-di-GMP-binding flagellar brake protein YcgR